MHTENKKQDSEIIWAAAVSTRTHGLTRLSWTQHIPQLSVWRLHDALKNMVIMELIDRALVLPLFTRLAKSYPFLTSISLSMKFRKQFLVSLFHNKLVRLKRDKVVKEP